MWKGAGACLNFEPSRSDERRINKLQKKSDQLGMERMWRVMVQAGQESRTKDVSVLPNSSWNYFLTHHFTANFLPLISSLLVSSDLEKYVFRVTLCRPRPSHSDFLFWSPAVVESASQLISYSCCLTSSTLWLLPVSSHDLLPSHWLKSGSW